MSRWGRVWQRMFASASLMAHALIGDCFTQPERKPASFASWSLLAFNSWRCFVPACPPGLEGLVLP